nr:uncharacterized protein LOC123278349 isoform X1 [Equus asinus]
MNLRNNTVLSEKTLTKDRWVFLCLLPSAHPDHRVFLCSDLCPKRLNPMNWSAGAFFAAGFQLDSSKGRRQQDTTGQEEREAGVFFPVKNFGSGCETVCSSSSSSMSQLSLDLGTDEEIFSKVRQLIRVQPRGGFLTGQLGELNCISQNSPPCVFLHQSGKAGAEPEPDHLLTLNRPCTASRCCWSSRASSFTCWPIPRTPEASLWSPSPPGITTILTYNAIG